MIILSGTLICWCCRGLDKTLLKKNYEMPIKKKKSFENPTNSFLSFITLSLYGKIFFFEIEKFSHVSVVKLESPL